MPGDTANAAFFAFLEPLEGKLEAVGKAGEDAEKKVGPLAAALEKFGKVVFGAERSLTKFFDTFSAVLGKLGGQFAQFVQLANPATVTRYNLALRDTNAVIGQILTPVIERFTLVVRRIGDAFASMSNQTKALLGGLGAGAGLAGVFGVLAAAVAPLIIGLVAVVKVFGPLALVATLGPALVGVFAGLALTMRSSKEVGDSLRAVMKALGGVFQVFAGLVPPLANVVGSVAAVFAKLVGAVMPLLVPLGELVRLVFEVVSAAVVPLVKAVGLLAGVLAPVVAIVGAFVRVLSALVEAAARLVGGALGELAAMFGDTLGPGLRDAAAATADFIGSLTRLVNTMRKTLGLDPVEEYDPAKKSSVGAATRGASIGDVRGFINAAYSSVASGGSGESIGREQLGVLKKIEQNTARGGSPTFAESALTGRGSGKPFLGSGYGVKDAVKDTLSVPVGALKYTWRSLFG